jgi:hypothetical protein
LAPFLHKWLFDPTTVKLQSIVVAFLAISILVRPAQRSLIRRIKDADARYKMRKSVGFNRRSGQVRMRSPAGPRDS